MADDYRYDVFLSYSTEDRETVQELARRLIGDGLRVWFDVWEILPGDPILKKIDDGIEQSRVLVYCMSINTARSQWMQLEAGAIRYRDPVNLERRFIPLRLDGSAARGTLASLRAISWLPADREQEYPDLLRACSRDALPTGNSATAKQNPLLQPLGSPSARNDILWYASRHVAASAIQMLLSAAGKLAMPPVELHGLEWWKKNVKREFDTSAQLEITALSLRIVEAWKNGDRHFLIYGGIASGKSTTAYLVLHQLALLGLMQKEDVRVLQFTRSTTAKYKEELANWLMIASTDSRSCLLIDDAHDGSSSHEEWLPKSAANLRSTTIIVTTRRHKQDEVRQHLATALSVTVGEYLTEPEVVATQLAHTVVDEKTPNVTLFREQASDLFRLASHSLLVLSLVLEQWKKDRKHRINMDLAASAIKHELELRSEAVRDQAEKSTADALLCLIWITSGLERDIRPDVYENYFGFTVPRSFWRALVDAGELIEVEPIPLPSYRSPRHPSWGQFVSKVADESDLFNRIRKDIVDRFLEYAPEKHAFRPTKTRDEWGCISTLIFALIQAKVTDIRDLSLYCSGTHFHDEFADAARQLLFVMEANKSPRNVLAAIRLDIASNARRSTPESMDQRDQDLTDCLDLVETAISDLKHAARSDASFVRTGFAAYELGYIYYLRGNYQQARRAFRVSAKQDRALGASRDEYAIMSDIQAAFCDCMMGEYTASERATRSALQELSRIEVEQNSRREGSIRRYKVNAHGLLFENAIRQHQLDMAVGVLREIDNLLIDSNGKSITLTARIRLSLINGDYEQAYVDAHKIVNDQVFMANAEVATQARRLYGDALLGRGDLDAAKRYYDRALPSARRRQSLSPEQSIAASRLKKVNKVKSAMTRSQLARLFRTDTV